MTALRAHPIPPSRLPLPVLNSVKKRMRYLTLPVFHSWWVSPLPDWTRQKLRYSRFFLFDRLLEIIEAGEKKKGGSLTFFPLQRFLWNFYRRETGRVKR